MGSTVGLLASLIVDIVSKHERSRVMSRVASKNTRPEKIIRSGLHRLGFRFRLHRRDLPGSPDLVFPSKRAVLFVHGCFWHAHSNCSSAKMPSSNRAYWEEKLSRNVGRDMASADALMRLGWRVRVVWTCEISSRDKLANVLGDLKRWLQGPYGA